MKRDFMLDLLDSVSDEHIFECAPPLKAKNRYSLVAKLGVACACLAVITVSAWLIPKAVKEPPSIPTANTEAIVSETEEYANTSDTVSLTHEDVTENTPDTDPSETSTQATTEPQPEDPVYIDGLQMIKEVKTFEVSGGGGHNFEIYLARDISDLDRGNPWDPSYPLYTLPVYKYLAYNPTPHAGPSIYLSAEKMLEIAKGAAANLGEEILRYTVDSYIDYSFVETENSTEAENPVTLFAYTESTVIRVSANGGYGYLFGDNENPYLSAKTELILPDEFCFDKTTTEDYVKDVTAYLMENYSRYFSLDNFEVVFPLNPYNFEPCKEEQLIFTGGWSVYEKVEGDYIQTLMNYYFNRVTVGLHGTYDEFGNPAFSNKIHGITPTQNTTEALSKLGDYPIITHDEALELLLDGKYIITDVLPSCLKNGVISREDVHACELVYRTNRYSLPYYMFLVELERGCGVHDEYLEEDPTLKIYGAFYVPAVDGKYLSE